MTEFDIGSMRQRLEGALREQDRAMSEVSLASGLSASYLHNILKRGQTPAVDKLERICKELSVSMLWVMYGLDVPPGSEEVFEAMRHDPERFWALMKLL